MGLKAWGNFSSIPNLFEKIRHRTQEREKVQQQISSDFIQFLINNGNRIIRSGLAIGSTNILYTTPINKIAYLFSANLSYKTAGAVADYVYFNINTNSFILMFTPAVTNQQNTTSVAFPFPIKLNAGETISVNEDSGVNQADGAIIIYELDLKPEKQAY